MRYNTKNIPYYFLLAMSVYFFLIVQAKSQTINTKFGKNRVQYHEIFNDWWLYENDHYIVYWYGKERNVAKTAILLTQISYDDIEDILDFKINKKIQLIIYSNIADFKQSNLGIKEDEEKFSGPGTTKFYDNKVIVYFNGDHNDLLKQIRKGTAKVFLKNMFSELTFENIYKKLVYSDFPDWFIEGAIDFLADKWSENDDEKLKNIFIFKKNISFVKLSKNIPELAGKSFFYFLENKYGKEKISDIFYLVRVSRDLEASILSITDKTLQQLYEEWKQYFDEIYKRHYTVRKNELNQDHKLFFKSPLPFSSLALSDDNTYLAYATNNVGKTDFYLFDIKRNKKKKILSLGYINPFQETDYNNPIACFDENTENLAIIFEKRGKYYLRIINLNTFEVFQQILAPEYNRVYTVNFLNDKNFILNANTDGYPDLYIYNIKTRQSNRLTHDFWDNLDAKTGNFNQKRGVIFSSNRKDTTTSINYLDTIPPLGTFDLFFLNIDKNKLTRLTNTSGINERNGFIYDDKLLYLTDETGINNIKIFNTKTGKEYFATDTEGNITSFCAQKNNILYTYNILCDYYLVLDEIGSTGKTPVMTQYKNSLSSGSQVAKIRKEAQINYDNMVIDTGLLFQSEFEDVENNIFKKSAIYNGRQKPGKSAGFEKFNSSRAVAARLRFSFTDLITKIDNQPLFEGMEVYSEDQNSNSLGQPTGFLIKTRVKDMFEDYFLEAGVRLSPDLKSKEYFSVFENIKHRIDYQYAYYRKTKTEYQFKRTNFIDKLKTTTDLIQWRAKYPFDVYSSINMTAGLRFDNHILLASDTFSLNTPNKTEQRLSLKFEYIFDNSSKTGANRHIGNRSKIFVKISNKMNINPVKPASYELSKALMFVVGVDARQYFKILGKSILAFRLSGQTSFGTESNLYFLGGMENWFFSHNDDLVPLPQKDNYAYRILIANMRGFGYNARNGSSYILSNNEIRVPVFQYLLGSKLKKAFLRNFQLTAFADVGTAWRGISPFSDDNPANTRTIEVPPSIKIKLKYYSDPLIAGYGLGIRSTILGYFLKFDYAWGIETRTIQKPVMYFTMGYDF